LNVNWTILQISLLSLHLIKRWSIVSSSSQKAHFLHPVQFLLARLSFVKISFLFKNHIKILIFLQWYFKIP
jgi:hypothetical protein